jgi:hypothetical protein
MTEKSESKRIGAKQHKNSGRNTQKGDASWKNFVVDFKEVGKSFTLNKEVWAKATTDAMKNGKDPAIVVVMGEGNSKVRLAIIEMSILEDHGGGIMEQQGTTIEMVNGLAEIADYMQDEELTVALTMIAKLIIKPDIPINVAHVEIVRLQAIAAKMAFKATWMANVDKSDRGKKNLYYTAAESLNNLVSALKYITR